MSEEPPDRTYWHVPGARSWHATKATWLSNISGRVARAAREGVKVARAWSECGIEGWTSPKFGLDIADRVPADGHFCGNCARIILARLLGEALG